MATIIINDNPDVAVYLAEMLYAEVDHFLTGEDGPAEAVNSSEADEWGRICELLATLACNPVLYGKLSKDEVDDLVQRADDLAKNNNWQSPNDFMFDYEVPEWEKEENEGEDSGKTPSDG